MKRQLILSLVLVLLIAIAAGTYFFVANYQDKQTQKAEQEAAALQLSNFNSSDVTKLKLHTPDLDYTVEMDEDTSTWTVTEGETIHINTSYITTLCTYGCGLSAAENIGSVDSATLETYELSDPISVTYYTDNEEITLYIGKQTATGEYFYMMKEGSDDVYLVDSSTSGYLYVTKSQLRYRYVVNDSTSDFTYLYLERDGETVYEFDMTDDGWEMLIPYQIPITLDNSELSSLAISIQELEADDFGDDGITEDKYAEYGFDDPAYTFKFEQEDGTSTTLLFEEYDPLVTSYIDCLNVETGEIYVFDTSYLTFLQDDAEDFLMNTLYKPDIASVSSMTIQYNGTYNNTNLDFETTFTFDYDESQYACDGTDFSDSEDAVEAFEDLYNMAAKLSYTEVQIDAEVPTYQEENVTLKITYVLEDGDTHTVELIPYESKTYWAYIDGEFSYVVVRQKQLSNNGKLLDCYTTFMETLEESDA